MKSNLNIKILKLCISEVCLQIGFEGISEQSLNILSDLLKYYIIKISLQINKSVGSDAYFEGVTEFLLKTFLGEDSFLEKEMLVFLNLQNNLKGHLNDQGSNKSLLHCLKILPNDHLFTGVTRNNIYELGSEPRLKTNFVNDAIEKDEDFQFFLKNCKPKTFCEIKVDKCDYDLTNVIEENKKQKCEFNYEQMSIFTDFTCTEIFNDLDDLFADFSNFATQKIFKEL